MSRQDVLVGFKNLAQAAFDDDGGSRARLIEVVPRGETGFEFVDSTGSRICDNGGKYKMKNPGRKARGGKRRHK